MKWTFKKNMCLVRVLPTLFIGMVCLTLLYHDLIGLNQKVFGITSPSLTRCAKRAHSLLHPTLLIIYKNRVKRITTCIYMYRSHHVHHIKYYKHGPRGPYSFPKIANVIGLDPSGEGYKLQQFSPTIFYGRLT